MPNPMQIGAQTRVGTGARNGVPSAEERRLPFAPVQLLGLCPLLAVSTTVANALGLAAATALVLIGSAALVSMLRHAIPRDVRLPCFVLIVATFTTLANLAVEAWAFGLYERIGLFVQIIVTNCLILGRLEQVAAKQPLGRTLRDALRVAALFAAAIACLGGARQLLAAGFPLAASPPGAFVVAGLLLALLYRFQASPRLIASGA